MTAAEWLASAALRELGYKEKASDEQLDDANANIVGAANYTKYAKALDDLEIFIEPLQAQPWNDAFVMWCFISVFGTQLGLWILGLMPQGYCYCANIFATMQNFGRITHTPEVGDLIFFGADGVVDRMAIVTRIENGAVFSVSGDTDPRFDNPNTIGHVSEMGVQLDHSAIIGYGRPAYPLS